MFRYFASMLCFKGGLYVVGGLRDNKRLRELLVEMFYVEENEWKNKLIIFVICEYVGESGRKLLYKVCFVIFDRYVLSEFYIVEFRKSFEVFRV